MARQAHVRSTFSIISMLFPSTSPVRPTLLLLDLPLMNVWIAPKSWIVSAHIPGVGQEPQA